MNKLFKAKKIAGTDPMGGFVYHLDFSLPFIAVAIHAGHFLESCRNRHSRLWTDLCMDKYIFDYRLIKFCSCAIRQT